MLENGKKMENRKWWWYVPTTWRLSKEDVLGGGGYGIGFSTLTKSQLGVNFQLECFWGARGSQVESKKRKIRFKSHRI